MAWIYMHKNKINGKIYVGQTVQQNYLRRWRNGDGYLRSHKTKLNTKFSNAIKKYGWDNFEHIIICECEEFELDFLEDEFIKKYDSIKKGYNSCSGGSKHKHLSEESKRKISIRAKNRPKINNTSGKPIIGIKIKTKEKVSFKSSSEASKVLKIYETTIRSCCRNFNKYCSAGGYYWCFKKDFVDNLFEIKEEQKKQSKEKFIKSLKGRKMSEKCKKNMIEKNKKKIISVNLKNREKKKFNSIKEASVFYNLSPSTISKILTNENALSVYGFTFFYEQDYSEEKIEQIIFRKNNKPNPRSFPIKAINIKTNEEFVFKNATSAIKFLNKKDASSILKCCKDENKTVYGYRWKKIK